mmetsp:Transcript_105320/g.187208  ORF Transcript_105320/g.187208 Transcript_105320/m.187208 type:complete len:288 (-) Transcript_105320:154-1017(-)|eukprot:CAMPEP_0197657976 /NCGR_PEP_ID=MMETSP1338-20131121/44959_1 /TAXON_ID=43686 ORGANISM="Pelagodinium beii, Strain RCC1491" /NCGR_SAMPLE_ID=MMETSP1338 /ASSEMBLY_ACC=CAM_ASM_000754 /LENGTH=287 /DNA_ID=CAMNT_0043234469 /DNA_START=67 /DNA_END=930 /DNA_ORIENTATION=-
MADESLEIPLAEIITTELWATGRTAQVFKGFWRKIDQVVAIKEIRMMDTGQEVLAEDEKLVFLRELAVLQKVHHSNLVKMYGVCTSPFRIITEFCEGGACFELLHNRYEIELDLVQQVKMCLDVADAVRYLHNMNIIHRDLKSLNLLLAEAITGPEVTPLVKVCDFGVARLKVMDASWGAMTMQAGTKHWMAPEMWRGHDYTEKVDVWSFAMVIYEIVCREVPFEEEDQNSVEMIVMNGLRPDMAAVPPETPAPLVKMMEDCWEQDPNLRPSFEVVVPLLEDLKRKC